MRLYYIEAEGAVYHQKAFTTEKLAVHYLSEDASLIYKLGVWRAVDTGAVVARLQVMSLQVV